MSLKSVGFIGGGNMTRAIVEGLLEEGFTATDIAISEPNAEQRGMLATLFPDITVSADNRDIVTRSDIIVLSVKPQIIATVCKQLAKHMQEYQPLVVSIAAGPRIDDIDAWLGYGNAIVRAMPNQPALLGKGVSGIFANAATSEQQLTAARNVLSAVGPVVEVTSEKLIDAVTAVSGSGPAYFYLLIDMIATTGKSLGLDPAAALQLAQETAVGAATLAKRSTESMDTLISRVRSPGGTTAAALDALESGGVRDIFDAALTAARDRATELADHAHNEGKH